MTRHVPHINRQQRDIALREVTHTCNHIEKHLVFTVEAEKMAAMIAKEPCTRCKQYQAQLHEIYLKDPELYAYILFGGSEYDEVAI